MSYDLNIYAPELKIDTGKQWARRLNQFDRTTYEFHPTVEFEIGRFGFWPIKVITPRPRLFSSRKEYISGFEMSLSEFDFENFFDLDGEDKESKIKDLEAEGLELPCWQNFRLHAHISFKPFNAFEATLSFLSAAILTEELNGLCNDPQTGQNFKKHDVFDWAKEQIKRNSEQTKNHKLAAHPFKVWR